MADEYIKRTLAKAEFTGNFRDEYPTVLIHALIDSVPAAEVAPVRHGRWRLLTNEEMRNRGPFGFLWASNSWMNYECSECGEMVHNELKGRGDSRTNYCHNCGAKMDGGEP